MSRKPDTNIETQIIGLEELKENLILLKLMIVMKNTIFLLVKILLEEVEQLSIILYGFS